MAVEIEEQGFAGDAAFEDAFEAAVGGDAGEVEEANDGTEGAGERAGDPDEGTGAADAGTDESEEQGGEAQAQESNGEASQTGDQDQSQYLQEIESAKAENARLKAELEALKATRPNEPEQPPTEEELPEDLKAFYEDYPEARKAILHEAEKLLKNRFGDLDPSKLTQLPQQVAMIEAQSRFNETVLGGFQSEDGKWIDGHPDALRVVSGKEFGEWVQAKGIDPTKINDPRKAIETLTQYKTELASRGAGAHDAGAKAKGEELKKAASGAIQPGNSSKGGGKASTKSNTFEDAFEEAAAAL